MIASDSGGMPAVPNEREVRRAMRRMPAHPRWAWVRERVIPVIELAEPTASSDAPSVTAIGPLGMRIGFGVGLRGVLVRVPESLLDEWRISAQVLEEVAMENLRLLAAEIGPSDVQEMEHEGTVARILTVPSTNATSLILIPDELQRRLGSGRQTLVTASRGLLVALAADASMKTVWDYMTVVTHLDPMPLREGPFVLESGRLEEWVPPTEPRRRVRLPRSTS